MKIFFLLILIIATITVNGQNHFLGLKGVASWTNVTASNFVNERNFRRGFASGVTYDYIFKNHFSTGADIIYNQRGLTSDIISIKAKSKFNYDYISMPLKVGFNYGKTIYSFANIGLTPSLLVDAKTITPATDFNGTVIPVQTYNVTSIANKFDIGGLVEIGGGYKFKEQYWLFTSLSYQYSFTTITNSDYFSDSKIRHNGMTLSLGLKCALTKEQLPLTTSFKK